MKKRYNGAAGSHERFETENPAGKTDENSYAEATSKLLTNRLPAEEARGMSNNEYEG